MTDDGERNPLRRSVFPVVVFTVVYVLLSVGGAVWSGNQEFAFYIAVLLLLVAIVVGVHFRVDLSTGVLWGLSTWGFVHMAGGLVPVPADWPISGDTPVLYSWWLIPDCLKYDHLVHAYGFGVTTWVCWEGLKFILVKIGGQQAAGKRPTLGMLTLCGTAALGFGALNEVVEFAATLLVPETNVGGYFNTGWDLVSNLVGVLLAACLIRLTQRI